MTTLLEEEDLVGQEAWEEIIANHVHDPVQFAKDKAMLEQAARNTLAKKNIHIGITNRVLLEVKKKAQRVGIPYQTFINSILHQYVNGDLVSKN
jgi:predicted DNA binding CopG/RHH family protein